jgi:hypothetical protein
MHLTAMKTPQFKNIKSLSFHSWLKFQKDHTTDAWAPVTVSDSAMKLTCF